MNTHEDELNFSDLFVPLTAVKAICFIVVIGIVVFFNSLFNNFVGDDHTQISNNSKIHSLTYLDDYFLESRLDQENKNAIGSTYYKPLLDTAFALTYAIAGDNSFAYHFTQLLFFVINAILVFLLFRSFFDLKIAFLLGVIYLVHPINSEAAIYISAMQEVLFTFFGLLTLLLVKTIKGDVIKTLPLIFLGLLCSILSKETGALYFMVIGLYILLFNSKLLIKVLGVEFLAFGLYLLMRIHAVGLGQHSFATAPIEKLSLLERLINIPMIFFFYLKTVLFPISLSSSYQWVYKKVTFNEFFIPLFIAIGFVTLISILGIYFLRSKKVKLFKVFVFFVTWFFVGILFHSQLLPLDQTVAERWFYFPIVGLLGLVGLLLVSLKERLGGKVFLVVVSIIVLLLSGRTFIRTFDYRDDFTLANRDILVSPESYNLEYIISHEYYQRGELDLAKIHAEKSIALFPFITNHTNLGATYSRLGDYKNARENYLKALEYGEDQLPYDNLVSLTMVYGDKGESIRFIRDKALNKYPYNGKYWLQLAMLEYMNGDVENAKYDLAQARKYSADPMINVMQTIIDTNKKLIIKAENGQVQFVVEETKK